MKSTEKPIPQSQTKRRHGTCRGPSASYNSTHLCLALVREEGLVVPGDARPLRVDENFPWPQRDERPVDVHGVLVLRAEDRSYDRYANV